MVDDFTIRSLLADRTPASRLEILSELYEGMPVLCECGCDCVIGRGPPMIDRETFLRLVSTSDQAKK